MEGAIFPDPEIYEHQNVKGELKIFYPVDRQCENCRQNT